MPRGRKKNKKSIHLNSAVQRLRDRIKEAKAKCEAAMQLFTATHRSAEPNSPRMLQMQKHIDSSRKEYMDALEEMIEYIVTGETTTATDLTVPIEQPKEPVTNVDGTEAVNSTEISNAEEEKKEEDQTEILEEEEKLSSVEQSASALQQI